MALSLLQRAVINAKRTAGDDKGADAIIKSEVADRTLLEKLAYPTVVINQRKVKEELDQIAKLSK